MASGFDLESILKAAQGMQAELQKAQSKLDEIEIEGLSGGGMVKVRATAKGRVLSVNIDPSLLTPSDKEMLEDLVAAAINDARVKAESRASEAMQQFAAGIPMPPGFNLPL